LPVVVVCEQLLIPSITSEWRY